MYSFLRAPTMFLAVCIPLISLGQVFKNGQFNFNEDGSLYLKLGTSMQIWGRYMQYNPGNTYNGFRRDAGFDVGIRRFRFVSQGQLTDRIFFTSQLALNNLQASSARKAEFFPLDIAADYEIIKEKLYIGGGLNGWSGFSRFSTPATTSILGIDVPIQLQGTNDITDQLNRKLGFYAKGYLGQVEYRIALAQPMNVQNSGAVHNPTISSTASYAQKPSQGQWNSYVAYQFYNKENNKSPYFVGTYLGKNKVMNVGGGLVYQKDAMWYLNAAQDTTYHQLFLAALDFYYDAPIGSKGHALTFYLNANHTDYGQNYTRNIGAMNPGTGCDRADLWNGAGNNYPGIGTGNGLFLQGGYFIPIKNKNTAWQPYVCMQYNRFEALLQAVTFYDAGCNIILNGHGTKFTIGYQNRPEFSTITKKVIERKSALLMQFQVFF